jgi:hypothetical protein
MVEIIRERDPIFEEEIGRDFKPSDVVQGDFTVLVMWEGPNLILRDYRNPSLTWPVPEDSPLRLSVPDDGRIRVLQRLQRRTRFVSLDQSRESVVVTDLGPAVGMDAVCIPCRDPRDPASATDSVEYAHAIELLDWAAEKARFYAARRRLVQPLRTAAWLAALQDKAEEILREKKAQSTFGYRGILQRS